MCAEKDWRRFLMIVCGAAAVVGTGLRPLPAIAVCVGDCNGDGVVRIAEAQQCVNLSAGLPAAACANGDQNGDGTIDPNEVDLCLQSFVDATTCPQVATPVVTPTRTATPTIANTVPPTSTRTTVPTATSTVPPSPTATNTVPPSPTPTTTPATIGSHKCTLAASSAIDIKGALPLPPLPASGAINIDCGSPNPIDGKAVCTCSVQAPGFGGLNIAGLFWACVKPAVSGTCPTGEIDCNGGNALGLTMNGKRNVGTCTGNADCTSQCATFCGGAANVFGGRGQCEGFCTDGAQAACTSDAQCGTLSQGSCNGPDGVGLGHVCDCNCLDAAAGGAGAAGTLQCQLAFNLTVEPIPGNGQVCDGADVSINVGDTCAPLSTQSSSSTLNNLNNGGTNIGPFADTGVAANCANLASNNTSGVSLVGSTIFYASTIGDLDTLLSVDCQ